MKSSNLLYSLYSWQSRVTSPLSTRSCCKDWLPRNLKTRMLLATWSKSKKREFFRLQVVVYFIWLLAAYLRCIKQRESILWCWVRFMKYRLELEKEFFSDKKKNRIDSTCSVYIKLCQGIYSEICKDLTWFLWIAFFCFISCNCSYFCELHFSLSSDL